jgi:hypothetical protein
MALNSRSPERESRCGASRKRIRANPEGDLFPSCGVEELPAHVGEPVASADPNRELIMVGDERLRPVERRIRSLVRAEVPVGDIAERFRRSPEFIHRVIELSQLSDRTGQVPSSARLRPIERRILRWRDDGASHAEIGPRFNRSAGFVERVEHLARYKLSR